MGAPVSNLDRILPFKKNQVNPVQEEVDRLLDRKLHCPKVKRSLDSTRRN